MPTYNPDGSGNQEPKQKSLYDKAMEDRPFRFFGKLSLDLWEAALIKGKGKVLYNPNKHSDKRPSLVIDMTVTPMDPQAKLIQRDPLAWTAAWKQVVRPSLEMLAEDIADIKGLEVGQFNVLEEVDGMYITGTTPERPDNKEGETWTTLQFDGVFPDAVSCKKAWDEWKENDEWTPDGETAASPEDPQRANRAQFLPALWQQAEGEEPSAPVARFLELIEENPMLSEYFDEESPEVQELIRDTKDIPV